MQITLSQPQTYLLDEKVNMKYMYDQENETEHYDEQKRLYHLEMAKHFQMMGDFLKRENLVMV
jgi:peroxiredoxin